MADPLSVATGVIGILTAAAQITTVLVNFTKNARNASQQASVVLIEVTDTSGILSHLQSFLVGTKKFDRSRTSLLQVDQVIAIVTGCVVTFSELEQLLEDLKVDGASTSSMKTLSRLKWSKNESVIQNLIQRLQTHKASLSLMLAILNGYIFLP